MKETIKIFRRPRGSLKIAFLAGLFTVSCIATFTGVLDMMYQSGSSTVFKIVVSLIFTAVVQTGVYYFSMRWWTTRVKYNLLPLCLTIFISVIFGWAWYFEMLGLDRTLAEQRYTEQRDKMIAVAKSNHLRISQVIQETEKLVAHSAEMVRREAKSGNTCDVTWQGFGQRASFRARDKATVESYAEKFGQTRQDLAKVHGAINADRLRSYSAGNTDELNDYAQELNAITHKFEGDDKEVLGDKKIFRGWLQQRIKHNDPGHKELFDNGILLPERIRCPDEEIERYYYSLTDTKAFSEISPIKILNPNKSGVQVIYAFHNLLNLMKGNFSKNEFFALLLAVFIDFLIFATTIVKPNSSPPAPFSSWGRYFPSSELQELSSYLQVAKRKRCNLYIPLDSHLKGAMVSLTDNDLAVFKGEIYRWKFWKWWRVPKYIRARENGSGFGHYQTHHSCPAQWVIDFKHEEQKLSLHDATSHQSDAKPVSDSMPQVSNGGSNKKVGHDITKVSLNGNNKGVEDAIQQ